MTSCLLLAAVLAGAPDLKDNYYPRLVQAVAPQVPEGADPSGFAFVLIKIGKDGHVTSAEVLNATEGAGAPIMAAAKQWVFEPLVQGGVAVDSEVRVHLNLVPFQRDRRSPEEQLRMQVNVAAEMALPPRVRLQVLEERPRSTVIVDLAKVAFDAGEFEKARIYSKEALDVEGASKDWNYGKPSGQARKHARLRGQSAVLKIADEGTCGSAGDGVFAAGWRGADHD